MSDTEESERTRRTIFAEASKFTSCTKISRSYLVRDQRDSRVNIVLSKSI